MKSECPHQNVKTWRDENGVPAKLWSCADCGTRFEPLSHSAPTSTVSAPASTGAEPASKCECSLSIRVLGDGCRYCQPQEYIDRLHEQLEEMSRPRGMKR